MKVNFIFPVALLAPALFAPAAVCLQPVVFAEANPLIEMPADDRGNNPYADGTRAINEGRWSDAEAIFTKIAAQHGDHSDAALYWKAYAQNKEGQQGRALESCADLGHTYPQSRWTSECDALRIEIRGRSGQPVSPQSTPDDELKLLALNALMQQDEARAMPAIQQILNGNGSEKLKERALFVLANSNSPEAQNLIGQIARGQSNSELQVKAIRLYAAIGRDHSVAALAEAYKRTGDERVKRAILQSYHVTGSTDMLLEVARTEQNPELVKTAVQTLGAMGATSDLSTLYREIKNPVTKSAIVNALIVGGLPGAAILNNIAATEPDPDLRRKAIRNYAVAAGGSAAPGLIAVYQGTLDTESKRAALEGLFMINDAHDLIALARAEKNPELKQSIVSKLSIMHSKEATDYMMEILNK